MTTSSSLFFGASSYLFALCHTVREKCVVFLAIIIARVFFAAATVYAKDKYHLKTSRLFLFGASLIWCVCVFFHELNNNKVRKAKLLCIFFAVNPVHREYNSDQMDIRRRGNQEIYETDNLCTFIIAMKMQTIKTHRRKWPNKGVKATKQLEMHLDKLSTDKWKSNGLRERHFNDEAGNVHDYCLSGSYSALHSSNWMSWEYFFSAPSCAEKSSKRNAMTAPRQFFWLIFSSN